MSDELSYSSHSTANQRLMSDELSYTSNMSPDEELVKAAKWGDFKRVKDAIENGAEVDTYLELSSFPDFFPALSWACHNGDVKIAKYLIEDAGANTRDSVWQAVKRNKNNKNFPLIQYLVESAKAPICERALLKAASIDDDDDRILLRYLLKHSTSFTLSLDSYSIIFQAVCESGDRELVQNLLEKSGIKNVSPEWHPLIHFTCCDLGAPEEPVDQAAEEIVLPSRLSMIRFLFQFTGANIHAVNENEETLLIHVCKWYNLGSRLDLVQLVQFIVEELGANDRVTSIDPALFYLLFLSPEENLAALQYLIDKAGSNPDQFCCDGDLPLIKIIQQERFHRHIAIS